MRKGKMVAQGSHASMAVLTNALAERQWSLTERGVPTESDNVENDPVWAWFNGSFAKVTVGCSNKAELDDLHNKAIEANLPCSYITDKGDTEFNGIPTPTAVAIGPWWADQIDQITNYLKLL